MSTATTFGSRDDEECKAFLIAVPIVVLFGLMACYFVFWDYDASEKHGRSSQQTIVADTTSKLTEFNDADRDGIADSIDQCPSAHGSIEYAGCTSSSASYTKSNTVKSHARQQNTTNQSDGFALQDDMAQAVKQAENKPLAPAVEIPKDVVESNTTFIETADKTTQNAGTVSKNARNNPETSDSNDVSSRDKDLDGIADEIDECPVTKGTEENQGCPTDKDDDGVTDEIDVCPEQAGPRQNRGCPEDSDADGLPNSVDECPLDAGASDNNGCPAAPAITLNNDNGVSAGAEKLIQDAGFNIQFNAGNTELTADSKEILLEVARVLEKYPSLFLEAHGHTDSLGSALSNTALSLARAQACLDVIAEAGISKDRLSAKGFGSRQPIANNGSASGRRSNRRVEFKLISE